MPFSFLITIHRFVKFMTMSVVFVTLVQQFRHSFLFWEVDGKSNNDGYWKEHEYTERYLSQQLPESTLQQQQNVEEDSAGNTINGFGACLMIKEDVDLLYEWIAYHYTVLPLKYLIIGSDIGNQQDPQVVLQRWNDHVHDLHTEVVQIKDIYNETFTNKVANRILDNITSSSNKDQAHHAFIHRQKAFVSYCAALLKARNVRWTTFIDSDEYVVLNRLGDDDDNEKDRQDYPLRGQISSNFTTVWDTFQKFQYQGQLNTSCYTMPRLLVGALENQTCNNAQEAVQLAQTKYRCYSSMSTLRFMQHAKKGDFSASKFGKVLMDLSQMPTSILTETTAFRNIHRPYKGYCGPGVVHFPSSLLYLNHYIGTWERYSSRVDNRRNRKEWEQRAYLNEGISCDKKIHEWFPSFITKVGDTAAKFLLDLRQ